MRNDVQPRQLWGDVQVPDSVTVNLGQLLAREWLFVENDCLTKVTGGYEDGGMTDVTRILDAIAGGDARAPEELFPLVYEELRRLAAQKLSRESPGHTLQATALVHEAYLRLIGVSDQGFKNRRYFFGAAAEAMRRILIENARRKKSLRHGGTHDRVDIEPAEVPFDAGNSDDLIALDDALSRLAVLDPAKAELVKLRFFSGLSIEQAAEVLDISRTTAVRHWSFARTWLLHEMKKDR
jgi:RNA polymerase sigma factor (TIGR02999 family)